MPPRLPLLLLVLAASYGCGSRHGGPDGTPADPGAAADRGGNAAAHDAPPADATATETASRPPAADGAAPPDAPVDPPPDVEPAPPPPRRVVIQGTGDYLLHTRVHNSARFHAHLTTDPDIGPTEGYAYLIYRMKPVLAKGDLNLVNLETPLATERHPQSGDPPMLNGPPIAAASLARAGFHAVTVANNHAYDQDLEGVVETRDAVRAAGLEVTGGGANADEARAPAFFERNEVRIGVLSFTEKVNRTTLVERSDPSLPQVAIWRGDPDLETIRSVRRQCDILVVQMHWGGEFDMVPNRAQRTMAADLCAAGVDLVLGAHSHTLQEVRRLEGPDEAACVVAYSLGNFLSNQGLKYRVGWQNPDPDRAQGIAFTRDGAVVRAVYEEDPEGRMQLAALEAVPLWVENNWLDRFGVENFENDIYVAPLHASMADPERNGRYAELYQERLGEIARALGDDAPLVAD